MALVLTASFSCVIMVVMYVNEKVLISEKKTWLQVCSVVHCCASTMLKYWLFFVLFCFTVLWLCLILKAASSESSHVSAAYLRLPHFRKVTITFQNKKEITIILHHTRNNGQLYNGYFSEMKHPQ